MHRVKKKLFYRSSGYMETLALESLKKCWRERMAHSEAVHEMELEEERKAQKEKELYLENLKRIKAEEVAYRNQQVHLNEERYTHLSAYSADQSSSSPLLLDNVVTPITEEEQCKCSSSNVLVLKCKEQICKARHERNRALSLARHYRNLAEKSQSEKRTLKTNLEGQIETVRDFWRNQVVEGSSRSGRLLRAALIRNT